MVSFATGVPTSAGDKIWYRFVVYGVYHVCQMMVIWSGTDKGLLSTAFIMCPKYFMDITTQNLKW